MLAAWKALKSVYEKTADEAAWVTIQIKLAEEGVAADQVKHWLEKGAQCSPTVWNLFLDHKFVEGKKIAKSHISDRKKADLEKDLADKKAKEDAAKAKAEAAKLAEEEAKKAAAEAAKAEAEAAKAEAEKPAEAPAPTETPAE